MGLACCKRCGNMHGGLRSDRLYGHEGSGLCYGCWKQNPRLLPTDTADRVRYPEIERQIREPRK